MPFGPEGLVVTWVGPVPKEARVSFTTSNIFSAAARVTGPEIPADFPKKYLTKLQHVELFNASMFWDTEGFVGWEKRHGIEEMEKAPLDIFENYIKAGYVIFGTLVKHPPVPEPKLYRACSVVLQRGVLIWNPNPATQTLFLRSYFHSAKDAQNFANFAPRGGIQMSFASETIWFPLELTRVIQEPASYVVLDILTPNPLSAKELPEPFRLGKEGQIKYQGKNYHVTRVEGTLAAKQKWPDLKLQP